LTFEERERQIYQI